MEEYKDEWKKKEFTTEEKKKYILSKEAQREVIALNARLKSREDSIRRRQILDRKQKALDEENAVLKLGREKPYFDSIPKDISVCTDDLDTTKKRLRHNQLLSSYYLKLIAEQDISFYPNELEKLSNRIYKENRSIENDERRQLEVELLRIKCARENFSELH